MLRQKTDELKHNLLEAKKGIHTPVAEYTMKATTALRTGKEKATAVLKDRMMRSVRMYFSSFVRYSPIRLRNGICIIRYGHREWPRN